jgi:HTH-type transcriptional regulator/antitoxin HigA
MNAAAKKLLNSLKEDFKGYQQKVNPTYMKLIEFFPLQTITSKNDHQLALNIIEKLITYNLKNKPEKGVEVYFKMLTDLVRDYESQHYQNSNVSGAEILAYLMELQGLNQADLSEELGGQPVVSKILKGERELNLRQIKALSKRFKVSPEVFI